MHPIEIVFDVRQHSTILPRMRSSMGCGALCAGGSPRLSFVVLIIASWCCLQLCYWVDIVMTFFTGYVDHGYDLIKDKKLIARNYLQGYFWVDILATFPWDSAIVTIFPAVHEVVLRLLRMIRVLLAMNIADAAQPADTPSPFSTQLSTLLSS